MRRRGLVSGVATAAVVAGLCAAALVARGGDGDGDGGRAPAGPTVAPRYVPEPCDLLLLISGRERGLLVPCGCTTPQRGGLPRRAALLEDARGRAKAWSAVSVGDTLGPGLPAQNDHKADVFRAALESMGYAGALLSAEDLSPFSQSLSTPRGRPDLVPRPPLNVKLADHGPLAASAAVNPILSWTAGDLPVRAVSLVDFTLQKVLVEQWAVAEAVISPVEAMKALPKSPGLLVVAAHVMREDLAMIAKEAEEKADLVVLVDVSGDVADRAGAKGRPMTRPLVVTFDEHGKEVALVRLTRGEKGWSASWSAVRLDPPYDEGESKAARAVQGLLAVYRRGVRDAGLLAQERPFDDVGPAYVGAARCATCHEAIHSSWAGTPHAQAFTTLESDKVDSWGDPECVGCHTLGWSRDRGLQWSHPRSAFQTRETTPGRTGVQCESCHGPGSDHVADPTKTLRMRSGTEAGVRDACAACHDVENSNGFNAAGGFPRYLPDVDHRDVPKERRTNKPR